MTSLTRCVIGGTYIKKPFIAWIRPVPSCRPPVSVMPQLSEMHIIDNAQLILGAGACFGVFVLGMSAYYLRKSDSGLPLPPSPPTSRLRGHFLPPHKYSCTFHSLFGNADYVPSLISPFLTVEKWIDEYGPLITIRSGTEKIVIIGRHNAAVDIMEKQGGSVADRPRLIAAGEILDGGLSITFAHVGSRLRQMRRALHTHLQPKAAVEYEPLQTSHAKNTVLDILENPVNFQNHAGTYAATTIMKIAYGKATPTSATDPEVIQARRHLRIFRIARRPGTYLVDTIPWLRYLPWYGQELKREFKRQNQLYTDQLNRVKQQIGSNVDAGPSFAKYALENVKFLGLTEMEIASLAGTFFTAGSDTTALAICTVLMAAACFPEEQAKVQAEIDVVVGRNRVPTFADDKSLPRLHAFISEALRWRPLIPGGLAHRTTQEVIWGSYCVPAGTTVFGDHWSISRDPDVFPEPHSFMPQRWINDQGRIRDDLKFFVFGFGRRVCPAQHLAERSVFINSLLILWAFHLALDPTKPLDDMMFMRGEMGKPHRCAIEFETRVPETELRRMMQNFPEVA
ncbi:cytochrome P450 [Suillus clintonianus]|uniref:cytochrome P450 n=1 Tax=Suillus clintonianus TaxID=1904413 RepID=UPI001B8836BF|nr:cytochrome P450 [Suillus clintonianus]KAG2142378.1 cytochrome P450 [Suillus clintonianus]